MRRLLATSFLILLAFAALAASASAASKAPVISSVSPTHVQVGQKLIIKGKYFKKGITNNRVFFMRASDGKSVRARPSKANSNTRMEVIVPKGVADFLTITNGVASPTRFQIQILSGKFSKLLAKSKSPIISAATTTPGTGTPTPAPPPADCDNDGTPNSQDADDDNDGLTDDLETAIKTDPCNKDTDGDGVNDAYEYYASLDLNHNPTYAGKRPYPNPLDATDAVKDFDGDGMTMVEEYNASVAFGNSTSAPLSYSDGNQTSAAPNGTGAMDLDNNGRITDEEKDADNDGLPNWVEMAKGDKALLAGCTFDGPSANAPNIFTNCGNGDTANGNTFALPSTLATGGATPPFEQQTDYLQPDTDGDGITDGADDQDQDGIFEPRRNPEHVHRSAGSV